MFLKLYSVETVAVTLNQAADLFLCPAEAAKMRFWLNHTRMKTRKDAPMRLCGHVANCLGWMRLWKFLISNQKLVSEIDLKSKIPQIKKFLLHGEVELEATISFLIQTQK